MDHVGAACTSCWRPSGTVTWHSMAVAVLRQRRGTGPRQDAVQRDPQGTAPIAYELSVYSDAAGRKLARAAASRGTSARANWPKRRFGSGASNSRKRSASRSVGQLDVADQIPMCSNGPKSCIGFSAVRPASRPRTCKNTRNSCRPKSSRLERDGSVPRRGRVVRDRPRIYAPRRAT